MKRHIITISGVPGSGKSSTAKGIALKLGYEHFSSGDLFRKIAAERGISIEEINFTAEKQKEIDLETDEFIRNIGSARDKFVMDSRTAFHWIPDSFKIFLYLDPRIAAERVFAHIAKEGRVSQISSSVEETYGKTIQRLESERKRYMDLYGIDFTDKENFDLYLDTSLNTLEEVIDMVISAYDAWLDHA